MGTRSDIIALCGDGKWRRIYCHWDGYIEHNGLILFNNYTDQAKIDALMALGDLSSLGAEIGERHPFDWRKKIAAKYKGEGSWYKSKRKAATDPDAIRWGKMCLVYGRDRGEEDTAAEVADSPQALMPEADTWTEFTYLWDGERWRVGSSDEGIQTMRDLGEVLLGNQEVRALVKVFGQPVARHSGNLDQAQMRANDA